MSDIRNIYWEKNGELNSEYIRDFEEEIHGSGRTFNTLAWEWFRIKARQLKISTAVKYANIISLHLIPEFGDKDVTDITRNDVIRFSRKLLEGDPGGSTGLSAQTVSCILSILRNIFLYASREKSLLLPDISGIALKQRAARPFRILNRSEQHILTSYLCGHPSLPHLGILLCLYTGLRIGEICALRWSDIDLAERCINIHHSAQRIQMPEAGGRRTRVIIQAPKTPCSVRVIPFPDDMHSILENIKGNDDDFLLTGRSDGCMEPRTMENHFRRAAKCCNIENINFHALRHTFATRCVELGFDTKSLSEILGHSDISITLNRYVHPSMELKKKNMNMLSGLFSG